VIRSEDDGAHAVVEVKESVRSHKVLLELNSKRVALLRAVEFHDGNGAF